MPLPLIPLLASSLSAVMTARNGYIVAGAFTLFKDEIFSAIYNVLEGDGAGAWFADVANRKLAASDISLRFRDLFDGSKTKQDLERFIAEKVNEKAGTNFTTIVGLSREDFIAGVGRVVAGKINSQTGAKITNIYPVDILRRELGTELSRQFDDGVDLEAGSLFPRAIIEEIEIKIANKFKKLEAGPLNEYWGPATDEKHAAKRAAGRQRQAKYRRSHKLVWVDK